MDDRRVDHLASLRRFAATDRRSRLPAEPPTLSFVADGAERITGLVCAETALIAVLEGRKDLWQGGREWTCPAGSAVLLPRSWRDDVVNIPDGRSGFYRAVVLIFSDDMLRALAARLRRQAGEAAEGPVMAVDALLGESLLRAFEGLAAPSVPKSVADHRVAEVALLLFERGALDLDAAAGALGPRLRAMVRARPDDAPSLAEAARRLDCSPATLKRRLAAEGLNFSGLVSTERMALAQDLIARSATSLTEIAGACGYRSLSKFSRRFRAVTGMTPDEMRGPRQ
jgi:AraC-like DNA-binding protein